MFLSDLSIRRPVFAAVLMLTLVTIGLFSFRRLAIDQFPDIEFPVVSVITTFPGASPESIEREVSKKLEETVNPIPGVKHVTSVSREGVSMVVVEFDLGVRVNDAAQDVRAKINAIRGQLPRDLEEPVIQKFDVSGMPVISLSVRSDRLSPRELTTLVDRKVRQRLENLSGVGKVEILGAATRAVNLELDPRRLAALGMGVDEVIAGVSGENVNTPLGRFTDAGSEFPLRISGKPDRVPEFQAMVIGSRGGRPITLGEVATVVDGIEEPRSLALVNGVPAIALSILKQTGANTVEVADRVLGELAKIQADLPAGVAIEVIRDGSIFIRDSVKDVEETILIGGLLTILIVFCFLNSWRSTVITGLTLPISVISSFIVMHFAGMTLNIMTLMGLSLAIGMLIDDAIVVRENIVRHLEKGEDHFTAASRGTAEIGLAVLATSLSIIAVFVPVAFMKGIIGRFFFQFGVTIAFAVAVSLFVSFTLDPMLSSLWYDPDIHRTGKRHLVARILDRFNAWFDRTADRYKAVIAWALDHRKTVLALAAAAFVGGLAAFGSLSSEFMVKFDRNEFQVNLTTDPQASLAETRGRVEAVLAVLNDIPEIEKTYATVGSGEAGTVRDASVYIKLVERARRDRDQFAIQVPLRQRLELIPGIKAGFDDDIGKPSNEGKPFQMSVRGDDLDELKLLAGEIKRKLYEVPGFVDLSVSMEEEIAEYRFTIDRARAADLGLGTPVVARTLAALVGGQEISTYEDEEGDALEVRVRLPEALRRDPGQARALHLAVPGPGGTALVPIGAVARYERAVTPATINRKDLSREVVIAANLDRLALGDAGAKAEAIAAEYQDRLPPGYTFVLGGEAERMIDSFGYMGEALLLAVIFVYLILAAQFESFLAPFAIMFSLPLAIVGMAGMLLLTGDTINIMSLIGLITLMGLVTKNAILMVDFSIKLREQGLARREAIITAGRIRLRPIMMTTLAMIFGMLPLALALGAGSELRAPMGRAVIGGLVTSTLLTLIVIPVAYTLLDDLGAWLARKWQGRPPARAEAAR